MQMSSSKNCQITTICNTDALNKEWELVVSKYFWHTFLATKLVLFQKLKKSQVFSLGYSGFCFFHTFCMNERDLLHGISKH